MTAVAVDKPRNGGGNSCGNSHGNSPQEFPLYQLWIYGCGGSTGSEYLRVDRECRESPNSAGGVDVFGAIQICGYFLGDSVLAYERYYSLDTCPENNNVLRKDSSQIVTVCLDGLVVTAVCTGQFMQRGSVITQLQYTGNKNGNRT